VLRCVGLDPILPSRSSTERHPGFGFMADAARDRRAAGRPSCEKQTNPRPEPKLLDRVRQAIRVLHYSPRTEDAYVTWIKRFILFNDKRHPAEMGSREVTRFLTHLAVERRVSASTQNQALSAILFLYKHVVVTELPWLEDVVRARKPKRLPAVLIPAEVRAVLNQMHGPSQLVASLLYGSGLRLLEALHLSHIQTLVRNPPPGRKLRHPHRPGTPGPSGREHHDDLHACTEPGRARGGESTG